ncbi:hypothetical protein CDD81_7920 [Ophiocordyceps australis]|uniref:DRBM domain-containing protein n=1 Tax=Ophiocordyceps australis TaxID=1399860 RepID=A0A2C5XZF4_9HYPO|nr:hypothetical protein CDD81_7920 [Ophiocordyceps australis]
MDAAKEMDCKITVPWGRLRAWIAHQEALEKEGEPAGQLSRSQLEAISLLVPFDFEEPAVDGGDHVSALHHTIQAHRLPQPTFSDYGPINLPVNGLAQPKWRCLCTIDGHGSFPRRDHGIDGAARPPAFQAKKDAKQYAAKHALRYLQNTWPASVSSPPRQGVMADKERAGLPSSSPSASATRTATHNGGDQLGLIMEQIAKSALCLGLNMPTLRIDDEPGMPGFFCGRAVFPDATRSIPPDAWLVTKVLGRKEARIQTAQALLEWMQAQQQQEGRFKSLYDT